MSTQWDWVLQNKTWLFSGGGITLLSVGWWSIRKLFGGKKDNRININVSPTISPTFNQPNLQTTSSDSDKHPAPQPPDIRPVTYKAQFAQGIGDAGRSCFFIAFRND